MRRLCLGAVLTLAAVLATAAAAERPVPPPYYAIRDARVVVGSGEILERATVLIADGLIEAVGPDLAVPADARVIDGAGLVVYPGLIDALTDLGLAQEEGGSPGPGGPPAGPGPQGPPIRGPEDRPATTPWKSAADLLTIADARLEAWREAGFTTALTAPAEGFFAGQAAVIHLGGEEPREMVAATPVAQRINFAGSGGFRTFPGSLMGGIAYVRQVLSDARWDARTAGLDPAAKRALAGGMPPYDRTLEPLQQAFAAGLPFLLPGDRGVEIDRALAIAREYQLKAIVYGAQGAYARVAALKGSGLPGSGLPASATPVVVSLDWPEAEKDRDPEADTAFRTLYHRRMAPATPGLLHRAGVPFAFSSGGLASPSKVFAGVRRAIDEGLPAAAAVEALTLGAARILGVDDRLGSIAAGKVADLVLATAEPWAEDAEIEAVFVAGFRYAKPREGEPGEPPASDVSGTWKVSFETPGGSREMELDLAMAEDGKVRGEVSSERGGASAIDKGRMSGDLLTFKSTRTLGPRTVEVSYSLTVEGDAVSGTMSAGPRTTELAGERTAEPEAGGEEGGEDDEPAVSRDELERAMTVYRGPVREVDGLAITHARVYTVSGETLEDATVVVAGGKIRAVGTEVEIPAGVEVIDAGGGSLIPGIIDCHSHIAGEGGLNEGSVAVSSMVTIRDVVDPEDVAIYRALAGGVTAVNVLHGSSNPIGGGNAVLKLRWGQDAAGLLFEGAPTGIKFALGENPKGSNRNLPRGARERYPATRMGVMDVIRQAFVEAREYRERWQRYEKSGKGTPPRRDLQLERLAEVLAGERRVHAHSYRADEILQLLRLGEELGFRIATLQHVLEGYKVADEIAAHGAGASTFSDWWGYKIEAYDAIPHNAALMTERGVVTSVNSDSAEEMRHLNQEAAKAMKWGGLDELEALKLVTLNPARQLGIDHRVGSIEVGKDADLVLYDGPPLSMFSVVQKTFVDGDLYFDRQADRERQALIDEIKQRLAPAKDEAEVDEGEESDKSEFDLSDPSDKSDTDPSDPSDPSDSDPSDLPAGEGPSLVLDGGTVHPLIGEPFVGRVVIAGGVIRAAGAGVPAPEGATLLDVTGLHVYPGLFDALGQLGLTEIGAVRATVDTTELGSFNPHLQAAAAIHPASEVIPVTRANGITHALAAPRAGGDGGVIAGQGALVHLDGWTVEEMAIDPALAMVVQWPEIRTRSFDFSTFSVRETPYSEAREAAEEARQELRDWLDAGRHYGQVMAAGSQRAARDLKLEALARLLAGEQKLIVVADRKADIESAVAFFAEQGLPMILAGGRDAWEVKELLADNAIPVILGRVQSLPAAEDDPYDRPFTHAAELAAAGVRIAFASGAGGGFGPGGPHSARILPYESAMAAAYGLPREEALKALTLYPAEILGVGDRLGSIAAGKIANLIVTDGDPLEITTRVVHLVIDGREVSTDNRHRSLYQRYRARP